MARDFPGTAGNYLSVAETDSSGFDVFGGTLTLHCLVYPNTGSLTMGAINKGNSGTGTQYELGTRSDNTLRFMTHSGVSQWNAQGGNYSARLNVWTGLGGRRNGTGANTSDCWWNGSIVGQASPTDGMQNAANVLEIGASNAGEIWDGGIAEVGVWNVALSDAEMVALSLGIPPIMIRRSKLVGYWPIYGVASPEIDLSGYVKNMTVNGTVAAMNHAPVHRGPSTAAGS